MIGMIVWLRMDMASIEDGEEVRLESGTAAIEEGCSEI